MKKALLIIDMSNDFVHDQGGLTAGACAQQIAPFIEQKANEFLNEGHDVYVCMDAHEENDKHFELWPKHNVKGSWGQLLYGNLQKWYEENQTKANLHWVDKSEYDAFYQTSLADDLKGKGIQEVHLTGVCTDICVFLTAYGAYKEGFQTVVYKKGTATFTNQHEIFLAQMKAIFLSKIEE